VRADIVPGGTFPDYELTDHSRTRRKLSELQGIDPMILVLSRGSFCPKDHQQHLELAANYPKINVAYTRIVTISTDNILETNEFRDSVGAQWTFLSDAGRHVQKDLDIKEYTDPHHDPMIPHTLVLRPGLVIYRVYNGYWFWGRPSFEDLRRDLREVTREVRPDWDLAALTKGGLAAATKSLAVEYASRGIRVNAVAPGIIQTPAYPADSYDGLGDQLPPLGKVGQVRDVVDAILFLESSPYITGEILHVDGGRTAGH